MSKNMRQLPERFHLPATGSEEEKYLNEINTIWNEKKTYFVGNNILNI